VRSEQVRSKPLAASPADANATQIGLMSKPSIRVEVGNDERSAPAPIAGSSTDSAPNALTNPDMKSAIAEGVKY